MKTNWKKIENWLDKNALHIKKSLLPGASKLEIKVLEVHTNLKLPQDVIEFYMIHNGQKYDAEKLMDGEELLCLCRIFQIWNVWKDLYEKKHHSAKAVTDKEIKNYWWNPKWLPLTHDFRGNNYSLDLDPSPEGNYGQIIRIWADDNSRELISPSFSLWISEYADDLEKEKFIYSPEYKGIIDREFFDPE